MRIEKVSLKSNPEVELSAYILDQSQEMSNIKKRPSILILPGGGYYFTSDREAEPIAMSYLAEGYNAFVLKYSVGKEKNFELALQDAEEAMSTIRERAEQWSVDTTKIAVIGFSAGGHLAAALSTIGEKESRPNALLLGYPCILSSMDDVLAFPVPSLEEKVKADTPATFLFTTFEDELVPLENSLAFINALAKAGIPFESHIFQSGGHGLSLGKRLTSSGLKSNVNEHFSKWFPLSVSWLQQLFGNFIADRESLAVAEITQYSIHVIIEALLENEQTKKVLLNYLPKIESHPKFNDMKVHSLSVINTFVPNPFTEEKLAEIDSLLKAIPVDD